MNRDGGTAAAAGNSLQVRFTLIHAALTAAVCVTLLSVALLSKSWGVGIVAGVVLLVLSSAVEYLAAGHVVRPLARLKRRVAAMADECDYTSEMPVCDAGGEIGELSASIAHLRDMMLSHFTDIARVLNSIAANDLAVEPKCGYPGDWHVQRDALENILNRLNENLQRISASTSQITAASEQLSQGVQNVSRGSMSQAETLHGLFQDIADIYERTKKNAEDAARATSLSMEAGGVMMHGSQRLNDMLSAMREISATSQKIGKVIKTVDDIAFQTNILALNASVEAARAGAAGKGFAVVADEVRSLANKSAEASKGTAGLIESTIRSIDSGALIAEETAQVFAQVMEKAKTATELTDGITKVIEEQTRALEQMKSDVESVSRMVHENASSAQEGAAASEELAGQAHTLDNLVMAFRLRKNGKLALR